MIPYAQEPILAWDLETNGLLKELTTIHVLAIGLIGSDEVTTYTDHDPRFPSLAEGVKRLSTHVKRGGLTVAHNGINFDRRALKKVTGAVIPFQQILDTMVMGRLRDPERLGGHKLEGYGIEMGILKGTYDGGWDHYNESMRDYCRQDVVVTKALYEKLAVVRKWGDSLAMELYVNFLIDLQMDNGFKLNVHEGIKLAALLDADRQAQIANLQRVFPPIYVSAGTKDPKRLVNYKATPGRPAHSIVGPYTAIVIQEFNPGSEHHVAMRLKRLYDWTAPLTEKGNPNITEEVLKKLTFPEVEALLKFAKADKRWTQLAGPPKLNKKTGKLVGGGWLHHTDDEDRVHGYVNPNGAVTGRMTHRMPNSANIDKDPAMRALWIPRKGWVLMGCDAEGIELRNLAHFLTPFDGGRLTFQLLEGDKSKGTDAHSINKQNTELWSRDGAKTLLYGSLYGAGDEKAGRIWIEDWKSSGKHLSEWPQWAVEQSKKDPSKWRVRSAAVIGKVVKQRLIKGIKGFSELKRAIADKAKLNGGWIKGLDGRRLRIRHAHAALNTLLQSAGAIIMKRALIVLYESIEAAGYVHGVDYGFCANVHDEWQIECRPEIAKELGEYGKAAITKAGEHFNFRCRLDGAYDIGNNWHETH